MGSYEIRPLLSYISPILLNSSKLPKIPNLVFICNLNPIGGLQTHPVLENPRLNLALNRWIH